MCFSRMDLIQIGALMVTTTPFKDKHMPDQLVSVN